ncbi:MAG: hypothetical protein V7751_16450 [Pseudoalteromonas distincta]
MVIESLLAAAPATGEPAGSGTGEVATDAAAEAEVAEDDEAGEGLAAASEGLAAALAESLVRDDALAEADVADEVLPSGTFAAASEGVEAGFAGSTGCVAVGTGSPLAFLLPLPLLLF